MKTKAPTIDFDPGLRIFGAADHLWVVFDSQSPNDVMRATRTVRVPRVFDQLSLVVDGFEVAADNGHQRELSGTASLAVRDAAGAIHSHELAQMQLVFHAETDRKGSLSHVDPVLVAYTVRQALSERLNDALVDFYQREAASASAAPPQALALEAIAGAPYASGGAPAPSRRALREQAAADAARHEKSRRRKTVLAWVVPPVLVVAVLATLSQLASTQSPIENAVAKQLANDPESIKAQVELTKQTLQSMGLDPGQGGDLGCLAPQ